ncbi:unnamed protein product [Rotaria sordida]|uniref:Uncharacterized protein n=1 Tax=Rotaria sordida TaxID=392033 RepID=A0A814HE97_9BILA|nr:unnamed protein product [Rotaria sordida]CAF0841215.1 unnamed protein product [Rotaria sordida]CAF1009668.1 unnamed protein product [Rotaria sordida]CAF3525146.1 unnamed protein product [Rotaria sordida]
MNHLFNEKVISAQPVSRDLSSSASGSALPGSHSGTRISTESGGQYLIHHGSGFAASGSNPTVITDAANMSSNWKSVGESYNPNSSVGGMMGTGKGYNVFSHNCNDVTAGMPNSSVTTSKTFEISTGIKPKK